MIVLNSNGEIVQQSHPLNLLADNLMKGIPDGMVPFGSGGGALAVDSLLGVDLPGPYPVLTVGSYPSLYGTYGISARIQVLGPAGPAGITVAAFNDTPTSSAFMAFSHPGGTRDAPTATLNGFYMGRINFQGFNDPAFSPVVARIDAIASEDFSTGNNGNYFSFKVTPNGSATAAEALAIHPDRLVIHGSDFQLWDDMSIDPFGAVEGQLLGFDGSDWIPAAPVWIDATEPVSMFAGMLWLDIS